MSCLKLCDGEDCYKSENDTEIYHIDYDTEEFLKEHCKHWFKSSFDDICIDCVENTNMDYPDFFVYDDYNLVIGERYIKNPNLLKL